MFMIHSGLRVLVTSFQPGPHHAFVVEFVAGRAFHVVNGLATGNDTFGFERCFQFYKFYFADAFAFGQHFFFGCLSPAGAAAKRCCPVVAAATGRRSAKSSRKRPIPDFHTTMIFLTTR
jgi:hypothetical protein